jgi:hypothetical protein
VAQGRLPQDQEQDQGDGKEQPEHPEQDRDEQPQQEADDRHEEGGDGGDMHELVLEVMAREELAQAPLHTGALRSPSGCARAASTGRAGRTDLGIGLGFAAEPAKAGSLFDLLAAFATEHVSPFPGVPGWPSCARPLYGGFGNRFPFVTKRLVPPLDSMTGTDFARLATIELRLPYNGAIRFC